MRIPRHILEARNWPYVVEAEFSHAEIRKLVPTEAAGVATAQGFASRLGGSWLVRADGEVIYVITKDEDGVVVTRAS